MGTAGAAYITSAQVPGSRPLPLQRGHTSSTRKRYCIIFRCKCAVASVTCGGSSFPTCIAVALSACAGRLLAATCCTLSTGQRKRSFILSFSTGQTSCKPLLCNYKCGRFGLLHLQRGATGQLLMLQFAKNEPVLLWVFLQQRKLDGQSWASSQDGI